MRRLHVCPELSFLPSLMTVLWGYSYLDYACCGLAPNLLVEVAIYAWSDLHVDATSYFVGPRIVCILWSAMFATRFSWSLQVGIPESGT